MRVRWWPLVALFPSGCPTPGIDTTDTGDETDTDTGVHLDVTGNAVELELDGPLDGLAHVTWLRLNGLDTSEVLLFTSADLGSCDEVSARVVAVQELLASRVRENPYEDVGYHLCASDPQDMRALADLMEPLVGAGRQTLAVGGGIDHDPYFAPFGTGEYLKLLPGEGTPYRLATAEGGVYSENPVTRTADEADGEGCAFLFVEGEPHPYMTFEASRVENELQLQVDEGAMVGELDLLLAGEGFGTDSTVTGSFTALRCDVDLPSDAGFGSLPFVTSFAY